MAKKHFFKPLLPGFHSHLTIPVAFLLKYTNERNDQKTAKLRSGASKIIWEVKIEDGYKLTDGWKDFALAHDLRIGDILIFRQDKAMSFHVTVFGPSFCEILYDSFLEYDNNLGKVPKKKNSRKETESSSLDPTCFVAHVSPSSLRYDTLYFPRRFVRMNRIVTGRGLIVLMNEKGRSWNLALKQKKSCGTFYVTRGWRSFCTDNGFKVGDSFTFKLIQRGRTWVLRLFTAEFEEEEQSLEGDEVESLSTEPENDEESKLKKIPKKKIMKKKNPRTEAEPSSLDPSCIVVNVSPATLHYDRLNLPRSFARANGLDKRCREIILMNEKGRSWTVDLKAKNSCGTFYIKGGWGSFCHDNGLKTGALVTFKLIRREGTPVLRLSPLESKEECSEGDEIESLSTGSESDEERNQDKKSFKKRRSIWKASSSPSQNRYVTLTLKPFNIQRSILYLPMPFTKMHGINVQTRMTMLDKHGVKWSTNLRSENRDDRLRLVGGWKDFFKANCVKMGESIMLKLIWEGDRSCVLKFCSKVKP